jgi:hypothetical protein
MTKGEVIFIGGIIGAILISVAMIISYHLYTNSKNREVYMECLRVMESIAKEDGSSSVRVFSATSCHL